MNHPIVPRRLVSGRRRSLLFLVAWLVLAAMFAPTAGAAIGEHRFLAAYSQLGDAELPEPCGAATGSTGDVYVADASEEVVKVFGPSGQAIAEFTPSANAEVPCAIAVDSTGAVYVSGLESEVVKYAPSANPPAVGTTWAPDTTVNGTGVLTAEEATDVAVDPSDQDVYVAEGEHISSYTPAGVPISQSIGEGLAAGEAPFYSVDVYGAAGTVYASTGPVGIGENEEQKVTVAGATGGTYALSFEGRSTGWEGAGTLDGSTLVTGVTTVTGRPTIGLEVAGAGIAPGTTIEEFTPAEGKIRLSQAPSGSGAVGLHAAIAWNATADVPRQALEALPGIGKTNVQVKCLGTSTPACTFTFRGALADTNVEQLGADGSGLTGSSPSITVTTVKQGVPDPDQVYVLSPDGTTVEAQFDGTGSEAGLLSDAKGPVLAVDQSSGSVLVGDVEKHGVIDEFDPAGIFLSQIGPTFDGSRAFVTPESFALAVDNGATSPNAGDIYATSSENLYAFGPTVEGLALVVEKIGADGGTVESTPAGLNCASGCSQAGAEFEEGSSVILKATGAPGSRFAGWEAGDCDEVLGTGGTKCKVVMTAARTVKANFVSEFNLTVLPTGAGSGAVTSSPTGIDCGSSCEAEFPSGSTVVLTAAPAPGSRFGSWATGDCAEVVGTGGTECKVTMSAAKLVEPKFVRAFSLDVTKTGDGSGTVMGSGGIACGVTCGAEFAEGTTVVLTAMAASGSYFAGWASGSCDEVLGTGGSECKVTLSASKGVTAKFDLEPVLVPGEEEKPGGGNEPLPSPSPTPNPAPTPPTPEPPAGTPHSTSAAPVSGGKAALMISCAGPGECTGTVKLTIKVEGKTIVLGKATYAVGAGESKAIIKVKLSAKAKKLLAGGPVKAKVSGGGLEGTVVLKPASN